MLSDAVAAGEGAFSTFTTRSVSSMTKSSTILPSGLTVWARTPAGAQSRYSDLISGTRRCSARTKAGFAEAAVHFVQADPPVLGGESPEAEVGERFAEVAEVDGGVGVTFAGEGEDGVRTALDHAAHALREVDAEKWIRGVGHGIDEPFHEVLAFGAEGVELAAEGDNHRRGLCAAEFGDAIAVEAGAVDDLFGGEFAGGGFDDDATVVAADGGGLRGGDDAAALGGDDFGEAAADLGVVDDAGFGDVDAGEADAVGFKLADLFGGDAVADDAVLRTAFEEGFHAREFALFDGDDDFAAEVEGDVFRVQNSSIAFLPARQFVALSEPGR